jgi:hypothetical protein
VKPALHVQVPVLGAQVPELEQVLAVPGSHAPALQVSVAVHAFPSSQLALFGRLMQMPFVALPAAILHAWQSLGPPAQAVIQHTESTQKLVLQSAASVHGSPVFSPIPQ